MSARFVVFLRLDRDRLARVAAFPDSGGLRRWGGRNERAEVRPGCARWVRSGTVCRCLN